MEYNWIDKEEYPFNSSYFNINGNRMHYITAGKGPTLLFVHGTPSWSFEFRNIIKHLSSNYTCIAIDHIGFGLSDKPVKYDYSPQQQTQNLTDFISAKKLENITLILHDFGGPIGLHYATEHSQNIKAVVVINSWMWSSREEPDFNKTQKILNSCPLRFLYLYLNFSARFLLPRTFVKKPTKKILKHYRKPFPKKNDRYGMLGFLIALANGQDWFDSLWQIRGRLAEKPSLLLWGMGDPLLKPSSISKFKEIFPNITIIRFENCGHFPHEERPEKSAKAIHDFLETIV